jgi:hypothetical protein
LSQLNYPDTVAGRRRHPEWIERCVDWRHPGAAGDELPDGKSLQATFRRGWFLGSSAFREKLLKALGREEQGPAARRRSGYSGEQTRDHGVAEAERIVRLAQGELGIGDWSARRKGDWRKGLAAVLIRQRSLVDNGWLAERLSMGARSAVSRIMREAREAIQRDRSTNVLSRRLARKVNQA